MRDIDKVNHATRIKVIGVGGGGTAAVNQMIARHVQGAESSALIRTRGRFIAAGLVELFSLVAQAWLPPDQKKAAMPPRCRLSRSQK